jgi:hypothetical protein
VCECILPGNGPRKFSGVATVVDRDQQIGAILGQHVGELRAERPVVDHRPRFDVVEQFGDFAERVVVVDVDRHRPGLQAPDHHVGVQIVVHDQRDAILAALAAFEPIAFAVRAESAAGQEVRESAGSLRRLGERAVTVSTDGHQTVIRRSGTASAMASRTAPIVHSLMAGARRRPSR